MLKGHVFKKQTFGNQMFALFINTFLDGANGISNNYKNKMAVTYSGSTLTVQSGAVCIQGRFLEEDTSTDISAGTDAMYCKLVIEIDLDKQNTETDFLQGAYKVIKSASAYPSLTQQNIVGSNSGVYQYELARFRTSTNGITDFTDMRTYLDFDSIYSAIKTEYRAILAQLQQELANVEDGSAYVLKKVDVANITLENDDGVTAYVQFKRTGNTVYVYTRLFVPAGVSTSVNIFPLDDKIPDFAKTTEHFPKGSYLCQYRENNLKTYMSVAPEYDIYYRFSYVINLGDESATDSQIFETHMSYVIDEEVEEGEYILGDVNGDGIIDEKDLSIMQKYIMGYTTLTDKEFKAADVNKDNAITPADYVRLKNYIDGVINSLE